VRGWVTFRVPLAVDYAACADKDHDILRRTSMRSPKWEVDLARGVAPRESALRMVFLGLLCPGNRDALWRSDRNRAHDYGVGSYGTPDRLNIKRSTMGCVWQATNGRAACCLPGSVRLVCRHREREARD